MTRRVAPSGPLVQIGEVFSTQLPLTQGRMNGGITLQIAPSIYLACAGGAQGSFAANILAPPVPAGYVVELVDAWMVVSGGDPDGNTANRSFQLWQNGPIGGPAFATSTLLAGLTRSNVPAEDVSRKLVDRMSSEDYVVGAGTRPPYQWPNSGANWTLLFGLDCVAYGAQQYIWELGLDWRYKGA